MKNLEVDENNEQAQTIDKHVPCILESLENDGGIQFVDDHFSDSRLFAIDVRRVVDAAGIVLKDKEHLESYRLYIECTASES